jgi:hypothetical protein
MQPCSDASRHLLDQAMIAGVDRSAGRPSDIGPAAECSHGGPGVRKDTTGLFLPAMTGFLGSYLLLLFSELPDAQFSDAFLDMFLKAWSCPEMASTVSCDSHQVAFSCAVDATLDSEFVVARCFLRTGFLVRMLSNLGGEAMRSSMTVSASDAAPSSELRTFIRCMYDTRTDRGIALYLAQEVPCGCMAVLVAKFETEAKTRKGPVGK